MITFLKILFSASLAFMIYKVTSTAMESNLFEEWDFLGSIPWMRATLWDFYANILIIAVWMLYRERNWAAKIGWLILFVCLGSIGTLAYVLLKLFQLKPGEGARELLVR